MVGVGDRVPAIIGSMSATDRKSAAARRSFSPAGFLLSHVHLKMKNPACAAVKREAEEDRGR